MRLSHSDRRQQWASTCAVRKIRKGGRRDGSWDWGAQSVLRWLGCRNKGGKNGETYSAFLEPITARTHKPSRLQTWCTHDNKSTLKKKERKISSAVNGSLSATEHQFEKCCSTQKHCSVLEANICGQWLESKSKTIPFSLGAVGSSDTVDVTIRAKTNSVYINYC